MQEFEIFITLWIEGVTGRWIIWKQKQWKLQFHKIYVRATSKNHPFVFAFEGYLYLCLQIINIWINQNFKKSQLTL